MVFLPLLCNSQILEVSVINKSDFKRSEVVAIPYNKILKLFGGKLSETFRLRESNNKTILPIQLVDNDQDEKFDEILFFAQTDAHAISRYKFSADGVGNIPQEKIKTFAKFVPERADDFAWENDKVAFRVYGPKGQKEALQGISGSTLSSGIDIWLKRVSYPIIEDWYNKHVTNPGYYHIDHGEGYDPYHVGNSRGTGGGGIWFQDSLQVSKNFTSYKIIANGPLRTIFELKFEKWSDFRVSETKRISIDINSNFSKFEISQIALKEIPNYAIGISLHKNQGEYKIDKKSGIIRHWEAIDDSFIGEGIVINSKNVSRYFANISKTPDQSNLLILAIPTKTITYYAGFAWQKSKQVSSVSDWDVLLKYQAEIIANPLKVKIRKIKKL